MPEYVYCADGAEAMLTLPEKSVKLVYGSPPYPNAKRNYGVWKAGEWIGRMQPFVEGARHCLRDDGFLVVNAKACRGGTESGCSSRRPLVVERFALLLEEMGLYCVDIEIWSKGNGAPTGLRSACQDAYEQVLWFSVSPKWEIDLDAIRRPYKENSLRKYERYEYKPHANGLGYVSHRKRIEPNKKGALPRNVITGGVSSVVGKHQAVQPMYLPERYVKACTKPGDLVVDPWCGTGTTGEAALRHGRRFKGYDVNSEYALMAEQRLCAVTEGK